METTTDQQTTIDQQTQTQDAAASGGLAERIEQALASAKALAAERSGKTPDAELPKDESMRDSGNGGDDGKNDKGGTGDSKQTQDAGKGGLSRKDRRAEWAAANRARIDADRVRELEERLKKLEGNGDKPVSRKDFPTDEAYYRYIAQEEMKNVAAAQEEQTRAREQMAGRYQAWGEKIAACISKDEMEDYQDSVKDAGALAEYLGEDTMGYIEQSEVGPRMLYMILTNPRIAETLKNSHKYRTVQLLGGLEGVALKAVKELQKATSGGSVSSAEAEKAGSVQSVAEQRPAPRATGALGNGSGVKDFSSMTPNEMAANLQRKLQERRKKGF